MILGTKARYAVMAMVELAGREVNGKPDRPISLADLAKCQDITLPYLEQIFSKLKKGGIVRSVLGPGGGYILARAANEIRISEIIEAADESLKITRCDKHGDAGCMNNKSRCVTHDLWTGLGQQIHDYLYGITLANIHNQKLAKEAAKEIIIKDKIIAV